MGWLFGNVALCEESPENAEPAKGDNAPKAEAPKEEKKESSESATEEKEVKTGPKNTGDDPKINAKETEKAVAQEDGNAQASSGEGMAEVSLA